MSKFCMSVDIQDVITCATFCDDRLRGLGVARGRFSRSRLGLEAECLGSRLGLGHEGLVSIPA